MATAPCPRCGGLAPLGASFCPFCGSSLTAPLAGPPPLAPSSPGHYFLSDPRPPGYPGGSLTAPLLIAGDGPPGVPSPSTREVDRASLSYLLWAAVIWLATGVVSLVLVIGTTALFSVHTTTTGSTYVFAPLFYVVVIVSAALSFVEVLLLRAAFHRLEPVDRRFSTPSKLALLLIVGFVILLLGLVPLLIGAQSITGCIANSSNSTLSGNCSGIGDVVLGALVVLAGGIIALIGYVGCLIGIWRFGSRYQNDLFKVGAIMLIIPLLNVVGAILILIASQTERNRRGSPTASQPPQF